MKKLVYLILVLCIGYSGFAQEDHGYKLQEGDKAYGKLEIVTSESMKKKFPVLVFLPESYEKSDKEYPVVYFLHGVNKQPLTEEGLRKLYNPGLRLLEAAEFFKVIIATPIVGNSFYLDAPLKPENKFATYVGEEVPAHIDKNYRTQADRNGRILCGFSMGGYGAVSLLCRYPDHFSVACSRGGALSLASGVETLYWDDVGYGLKSLLGDYWDASRKNYHQNSCLNMINHIRDRDDVAIVLEVGTEDFLYKINQKFREKLLDMDFPHIYAQYPGGHYLDANCLRSLLSHLQYFNNTIE